MMFMLILMMKAAFVPTLTQMWMFYDVFRGGDGDDGDCDGDDDNDNVGYVDGNVDGDEDGWWTVDDGPWMRTMGWNMDEGG